MNHVIRSVFGVSVLAVVNGVTASAQIDSSRATAYFREAAALCEREASQLWGRSLCGPMVFADPVTRTIMTNQPQPTAPRPAALSYANAAIKWGPGRWSMFVWQAIPGDARTRGRLFMHELYHRIQPELGLRTPDGDNAHLNTEAGRTWMQLEWRALARTLAVSGPSRNEALRDALAFRAERRRVFTVAATASTADAIEDAIGQLGQAPEYETFVRTFAYSSGAAYGILLDAFDPGWTRRLRVTDDLGDLADGCGTRSSH